VNATTQATPLVLLPSGGLRASFRLSFRTMWAVTGTDKTPKMKSQTMTETRTMTLATKELTNLLVATKKISKEPPITPLRWGS
jgi:hypothetical protein